MYQPYTWTTGEVITEEKLNNLEQGVADVLPTYDTSSSCMLVAHTTQSGEKEFEWREIEYAITPYLPYCIGEIGDGDRLDANALDLLNYMIRRTRLVFARATSEPNSWEYYYMTKTTSGEVTLESGSHVSQYYYVINLSDGTVTRAGGNS